MGMEDVETRSHRPTPTEAFARLLEIVASLRAEGGCPWDRAQTLASLKSDMLEEAHEFVEAVDDDEPPKIEEELGDLLINVVLNAQIAGERGLFDILSVVRRANEKLVRRHPHVFGDADADTPARVLAHWEAIKRGEAGYEARTSLLDGLPAALPALMAAQKLQARAARVGFDWERAADVLPKIREELSEIEACVSGGDVVGAEMEVGDLLFAVVNLARLLGVEPESSLRKSNAKFRRRFRRMEAILSDRGESFADHDLAGLDRIWDRVKDEECAEATS
jgi:MazG family protein